MEQQQVRRGKRRWIPFLLIAATAFGLGIGLSMQNKTPFEEWASKLDAILGEPFPQFTLTDLKGNQRDSREWKGHVVVLNFWATWCPPCIREMPMFDALYQKYSDQQVTFVGIAIDKQMDVEKFVTEKQISYPILMGDDQSHKMAKSLGNSTSGLPFTVIFDRTGSVADVMVGEVKEEQLENLIKKLTGS